MALRWNEKGFGFIKPDDGGEDIFCHFSGIEDGKCLMEGAKVEYRKTYDERKGKYRAEQVTGGAPEPEGGFGGGGFGGGGYGGGKYRVARLNFTGICDARNGVPPCGIPVR